jgi:bifunctional non-homologous end joining protein LigD
VFDLLWLDGKGLWRRPWHGRRHRLGDLGLGSGSWHVPASFPRDDLAEVSTATARLGLEGIVGNWWDGSMTRNH